MADLFQGVVAPDVNTTKTQTTTAPSYYTDYLSNIAQVGSQALGNNQIAPLTAMQTAGYGAIPTAATAYQPGLATATGTAAGAAGSMTPQGIQQFMNPYTSGVVDEMGRLQQQNIQRNVLPAMKGAFVGSGGLGGQRYANAFGQTMADMQSNLTGQQTSALQKGYEDALQAAYNQGNLLNTTARTQADLAGQEQALGLTGAGALTKAGAEQQAYQQSILDQPLKNATNVAALLKGYTMPTSTTETYKGPMSGVYGNSPLSQVAGLGTLLGSMFNPTVDSKGNVVGQGFGTQMLNSGLGALASIGKILTGGGSSSASPVDLSTMPQSMIDELSALMGFAEGGEVEKDEA